MFVQFSRAFRSWYNSSDGRNSCRNDGPIRSKTGSRTVQVTAFASPFEVSVVGRWQGLDWNNDGGSLWPGPWTATVYSGILFSRKLEQEECLVKPACLPCCDQDQSSTSPSRRAKAVQHATTKYRAHRVGSRTERVVQRLARMIYLLIEV